MAVNLAQPMYLLLLIPAAVLLAVFNGRRRYPPGSRGLILGLRAIIVLLLVLALARPHIVVALRGMSVIYLLDDSHSVEGSNYSSWVSQSLTYQGDQDRSAVVAFGRDTRLLKPFGMERLPQTGAGIDQDFTDIRAALETAYSLLPGSGGRIVLISDGMENSGDSLSLADMFAASAIPVDVVPIIVEQGPDVAISNINLPKNTWPGQQVVAEVELVSTVATSTELAIFWGSSLVFRSQVDVAPGTQSFSVPLEVRGQSLQRIRAVIDPVLDDEPRNNIADGITFVQAPPRVLVIEGVRGKGDALYSTLIDAGLEVDMVVAGQANFSLVTLASYRAIVLADVPAYALDQTQHQALETFVGVLGGGLAAVGGRTSFGLGLYQDTFLEQVLPVAMEVEQEEELPGLDMILVIDRSGSMMGEKLNMAKNASLRAVDILKDRDRLGVITFDDQFTVDLPLTQITQADEISRAIENIPIGGGTIIYPALEKAVDMLEGSSKAKHIILLSDGMEGAQFSYEALMERAVLQGISVSTIALGDGADRNHMDYLAELANGRSYYVPEGGDLPAVFVQEAVLAGGDWLVEEDFIPSLLHPDALALASATPVIRGYVASTAKPLAEVLLSTHRDHPLLARWQYGLGRAVAYTSDTYGMWSEDLLAHSGFASMWVDILNWVAPVGGGSDFALESRLKGSGVEISAITNRMLEEGEALEVILVDTEGRQEVLELLPAGRGTYQATREQVSQGVYLISARRLNNGVVTGQSLAGFAVPYPPEFKVQHFGENLLENLAEKTGGRVLSRPEDVFTGTSASTRRLTDITWWLLMTAIVLWPMDIALRRLGGLPQRRKRVAKPQDSTGEAEKPTDQTMERLLKAKRRTR